MIQEHFYSSFKNKSTELQDYFDHEFMPNLKKYSPVRYFGWSGYPVPASITRKENVLSEVDTKFKIMFSGFVMMGPNRQYHWHTDVERGVTINMLMTHNHTSYSLFGEKDKDNDAQNHILTVDYEPNTFYLFNTKRPHTIINFEEPRFLFTVKFLADADQLSYEDIYNWKTSNNL